jgi:FXSXX-COOH protein
VEAVNAVQTAVRDLQALPLAQVDTSDVERVMARVLPEAKVEAVSVAAFNSSI